MTRRSIGLLVTLALALFVAPLMADAQQPTKVYRVGRLSVGSPPEVSPFAQWTAEAFRQGLSELGHVEGQNLVLTWRFAEGRLERMPALATELVRLPVDVLVVSEGEPVIRAAQQATQTMPTPRRETRSSAANWPGLTGACLRAWKCCLWRWREGAPSMRAKAAGRSRGADRATASRWRLPWQRQARRGSHMAQPSSGSPIVTRRRRRSCTIG